MQSLYILINGGVSVVQSLEISSFIVENPIYQELLFKAADSVKGGQNLSSYFALHSDYFPPLVSAMITVGEKTGRMDEMLQRIANIYARDILIESGRLTELIQPILIVFLAVLVGGLFASILMPLYSLIQNF